MVVEAPPGGASLLNVGSIEVLLGWWWGLNSYCGDQQRTGEASGYPPNLCGRLHWVHVRDRHHGHGHLSCLGRGHGRLGFEIVGGLRSRGRGRGLGHGDHPCEESSRGDEASTTDVEGECDHDDYHEVDHGQSRIAKMQKAVYEPTREKLKILFKRFPVCSNLDFQQVISTNTFVVHFMVGIVGVTAALVLNKGEAKRY